MSRAASSIWMWCEGVFKLSQAYQEIQPMRKEMEIKTKDAEKWKKDIEEVLYILLYSFILNFYTNNPFFKFHIQKHVGCLETKSL